MTKSRGPILHKDFMLVRVSIFRPDLHTNVLLDKVDHVTDFRTLDSSLIPRWMYSRTEQLEYLDVLILMTAL